MLAFSLYNSTPVAQPLLFDFGGPIGVERIVKAYGRLLAGEIAAHEVVRALKAEGGYGVVRGSLRVMG